MTVFLSLCVSCDKDREIDVRRTGRCRVGGRFLAKSCNLNDSFFFFADFSYYFLKVRKSENDAVAKVFAIYFHILPYTSIYYHILSILSIYFPYVLPYSHTSIP
jgi:hypothetical protein